MEEPRKVLRGMLVGTKQVDKPCGIDVIRGAIDELMDNVPKAEWRQVCYRFSVSSLFVLQTDRNGCKTTCNSLFVSPFLVVLVLDMTTEFRGAFLNAKLTLSRSISL